MANGYKADCACQKTKRKDSDKDPKANHLKTDEDMEKKKDEEEADMPGYAKKLAAGHEKIMDMLKELMGKEKSEKKEEDSSDEDMVDEDKEDDKGSEDYDNDDPEEEAKDVEAKHKAEAKEEKSKGRSDAKERDVKRRDSINRFKFRVDASMDDDTPQFVACTREGFISSLKKGNK